MFFKKVSGGASAGKILFAVLLTLCCTVSLTFTVSAAENNEIRLIYVEIMNAYIDKKVSGKE